MYKVPTQLGIDIRQIADTVHVNDMELLIRIGPARDPVQDNLFNVDEAVKAYYKLAPFHTLIKKVDYTLLRAETPPE